MHQIPKWPLMPEFSRLSPYYGEWVVELNSWGKLAGEKWLYIGSISSSKGFFIANYARECSRKFATYEEAFQSIESQLDYLADDLFHLYKREQKHV